MAFAVTGFGSFDPILGGGRPLSLQSAFQTNHLFQANRGQNAFELTNMLGGLMNVNNTLHRQWAGLLGPGGQVPFATGFFPSQPSFLPVFDQFPSQPTFGPTLGASAWQPTFFGSPFGASVFQPTFFGQFGGFSSIFF
jgi:hypothetical protein